MSIDTKGDGELVLPRGQCALHRGAVAPVGHLRQALRGHGVRLADDLAGRFHPAIHRCVSYIISLSNRRGLMGTVSFLAL